MNIRIQIIIGIIVVMALCVIVNMIRKKRLELRYALAWLIVGVGIFVLDCFPQLITWMARTLGIASPINMLFFLGFCFSLMIIFVLTVAVSRASIRIKELAQALALYEKRMDEKNDSRKRLERNIHERLFGVYIILDHFYGNALYVWKSCEQGREECVR